MTVMEGVEGHGSARAPDLEELEEERELLDCNLAPEDRKKFCVEIGIHCIHRNDDGTKQTVCDYYTGLTWQSLLAKAKVEGQQNPPHNSPH